MRTWDETNLEVGQSNRVHRVPTHTGVDGLTQSRTIDCICASIDDGKISPRPPVGKEAFALQQLWLQISPLVPFANSATPFRYHCL